MLEGVCTTLQYSAHQNPAPPPTHHTLARIAQDLPTCPLNTVGFQAIPDPALCPTTALFSVAHSSSTLKGQNVTFFARKLDFECTNAGVAFKL